MSDFQRTVRTELDRDIEPVRASELDEAATDCEVEECGLNSLVLGLVRMRSYSFLEYLEESAITAVKIVIRVCVLMFISTVAANFLSASNRYRYSVTTHEIYTFNFCPLIFVVPVQQCSSIYFLLTGCLCKSYQRS